MWAQDIVHRICLLALLAMEIQSIYSFYCIHEIVFSFLKQLPTTPPLLSYVLSNSS